MQTVVHFECEVTSIGLSKLICVLNNLVKISLLAASGSLRIAYPFCELYPSIPPKGEPPHESHNNPQKYDDMPPWVDGMQQDISHEEYHHK